MRLEIDSAVVYCIWKNTTRHCTYKSSSTVLTAESLPHRDGRAFITMALEYNRRNTEMDYSVCEHCSEWSYWYNGRMVIPSEAPVPPAHVDMPQTCRADYDEARTIVAASPERPQRC